MVQNVKFLQLIANMFNSNDRNDFNVINEFDDQLQMKNLNMALQLL